MIAEQSTKKWSIEEFHRLAETQEWARHYELIEGDLIQKMAEGNLHVYLVNILIQWLRETFGYEFVRQEDPLRFVDANQEESEPEPDAMVLTQPFLAYLTRRPEPEETLLVAEVAVSSIGFDSTRKVALYARAGIAEYWIVEGEARRILVFRHPENGDYTEKRTYTENDEISLLSRPEAKVRVDQLLPPSDAKAKSSGESQ